MNVGAKETILSGIVFNGMHNISKDVTKIIKKRHYFCLWNLFSPQSAQSSTEFS